MRVALMAVAVLVTAAGLADAQVLEPAPVTLPENSAPPTRTEVEAILGSSPLSKTPLRKLHIVLCASPKDAGHLQEGAHDYPLWRERWTKLLAGAEGVTVEGADGWPTRAQWKRADVVVFNSYNPEWAERKAGDARIARLAKDIDTFTGRGGGLVFLHYSLNAGANGDALAARLGLAWVSPPAGYRYGANAWQLEGDHPITAGLRGFKVPDEAYWNLAGDLDKAGAHVLMRSVEEGAPRPQMWTRKAGKGRVFVSIPGHYTATFDDPIFRILIFRGMMWSAREPVDRLAPLVPVGARFSEERAAAAEPPGKAVFQNNCAVCHDRGATGAPPSLTLAMLGGPAIHQAMTAGRMRAQAAHLSDLERRQIAEYLSGRSLDAPRDPPPKACAKQGDWFDARRTPVGTGWGIDRENTRSIPASAAGLSASDLSRLQLKWAVALPGVSHAIAQPLVAGGGLFVGSADGHVYAFDARSGCLHWTFKATAEVLGGIVIQTENSGRPRLFFADRLAHTYALDAVTGEMLWRIRTDDHPSATIMGTPALHEGRLFVPIISFEENAGGAEYPCCTFRGSLVALDAATGRTLWKRYTIPSPAVEQFKNALGVPQFAPSGAGIWSAPTIDVRRNSIFFTTGNSYSEPTDDNGDAVFALDLRNGSIKWRTQTLAGDAWVMWDHLCRNDPQRKSHPGCPALKNPGPDIDFTTSPVLVRGNKGRDVLVAGRKDGTTFGFDPDTGKVLWSTRTSSNPDPNAGALNFGLAVQDGRVFLPSTGTNFPNAASFIPSEDDGLFALDARTGARLWAAKVTQDCDRPNPCTGLSFAPLAIPGVVFAGSTDGYVRAYEAASGRILWRFDTAREFGTLNGARAKGGAIGRNSIMVADGMVYVGSGYSRIPGNVLLAFSVGAAQ